MPIIVYREGRCFERRYTRDWRVPLEADDKDFRVGWQNIPLPPSYDAGWVIFDSSHDRKTGWERELCAADIVKTGGRDTWEKSKCPGA